MSSFGCARVVGISLLLASGLAAAAVGKPHGQYVATDSRAPQITLPVSFLTLPTDGDASGTIADTTALATADDAKFDFDTTPGGTAGVYGSALGTCSVHVNGFIDCSGISGSPFINSPLGNGALQSALAFAPFWDDLIPVAGLSTITWEGKTASWIAVQWNDMALASNPSARLTFRVTIQQGASGNNGYILFQYIKMTGTGSDGAGATIGIQENSFIADSYSVNRTGAVLNGTATSGQALQAILFDFDTDGDRLTDSLEALKSTNPALIDSDGGGLDDGAEVAAGKDPTMAGDDAAGADADGDTLSAGDEAFYGTDPNQADTDHDSIAGTTLNDQDELFTTLTDPTLADTDRDGYKDGTELQLGSDPFDPESTPSPYMSTLDLTAGGTRMTEPRAAVDSNGYIHVIATDWTNTNHGVFYGMFNANGTARIPMVLLPAPGSKLTRAAHLSIYNDKVYVIYSACTGPSFDCQLRMFRIDPSTAPQDGSAVTPNSITDVDKAVPVPSSVTAVPDSDVAAGSTGLHVLYVLTTNGGVDHTRHRSQKWQGFRYARLDLDGNAQVDKLMIAAPTTQKRAHASRGVRIALDPTGTAHLLMWAHPGKTQSVPRSLYWASISGSTIVGPYHIPNANTERGADIAFNGSDAYIAYNGSQQFGGIGILVFDPSTVTTIARTGDRYGISSSLDPASMSLAPTLLGDNGNVRGARVFITAAGDAVIGYQDGGSDQCFQGVTKTGLKTGPVYCNYSRQSNKWQYNNAIIPVGANALGVVMARTSYSNKFTPYPLRLARISLAAFTLAANQPPKITSTPPASASVGVTYSYTVIATDDGGQSGLRYTLVSSPSGMTISPTGLLTWTPTAQQQQTWDVELQVCDLQNACDGQKWSLMIPGAAPGSDRPPVFVSVPPATAEAGIALTYSAQASDPDGDSLTFSLVAPSPAPAGLTLSTSGQLTWTPTTADIGPIQLTLEVADPDGLTAQQVFTLTVVPAGSLNPPAGGFAFTSIPATSAVVGRSYAYQAVAADPAAPGAVVSYALVSTDVDGVAVDSTGLLTWKPIDKERGTVTITLRATSGSKVATQSYTVSVLGAPGGDGCTCSTGHGSQPLALGLLVGLLALRPRRRRKNLAAPLALAAVLLIPALAHAKHGPRDIGGYLGTDSRAPKITLPASYLTLSTGEDATGTVANSATLINNGDDFTYPVPMPGTATLYGHTLDNCFAHTNGVITCGPAQSAAAVFSNATLASAFPGYTVLSPFWDDLAPVAGTSTITWGQKNGQWFYVQWNDFALLADPSARLTFRAQVRLDSASNQGAILFQYVRMELSTSADGRGATIGIRDARQGLYNDYSVNTTGAVVTGPDGGGTALQAILFDHDTDGDRLGDTLEPLLSTDPTLQDTDGGHTDDGAEVFNGTDPTLAGDDAPGLDGDADGLYATSEIFYGTNPAVADTDGDSVVGGSSNDGEEITAGTDPLNIDTDSDTVSDGAEKRDGSDPLDPTSPSEFGVNYDVSGNSKHFPQLAVDANGDIHGVGDTKQSVQAGIYYYMVGPDAKAKIPETLLKSQYVTSPGTDWISRPNVATFNGKVYITYELRTVTKGSSLCVFVVDPSLAPRDGTAIIGATIITAQYQITLSSYIRDHDMAIDAAGLHVVYKRMFQTDQTNEGFDGDSHGFAYALISLTGTLVLERTLMASTGNKGDNARGFHNNGNPRVAIDATGVVHVLMNAMRGRPSNSGSETGTYYARITGGKVSGPYYLGSGFFDRVDLDVADGLVSIFGGSGGGNMRSNHSRIAVLTTGPLALIPRAGDPMGVTTAVDPESFVLPWTETGDTDAQQGAQVRGMPGGKAMLAGFITKSPERYCIHAFTYRGVSIGQRRCLADVSHQGHKFASIVFSGNQIGLGVRGSSNSSEFRIGLISAGLFPTTGVMAPTMPPTITSIPVTVAGVGGAYSYAPVAADPDTAAGSLTWTAPSKPAGMTIASNGTLSWTPSASDLGAYGITIRVCDPDNHCASQVFTLAVVPPGAPAITSTPPPAAVAGFTYTYQVIVSDPDQNVTSYAIVSPSPAPGNMAIDATGKLTWSPALADVGVYGVTIKATDATNMTATQSYTLTVVDPNQTPSTGRDPNFVSVPSTVAMYSRLYTYQAVATDPVDANATISYELASPASGDMKVDASTGMFTWTPDYDERKTIPIAIRATSSNGGVAIQTFSLTVITEPTYGCCSTSRGGYGGPFTGAIMGLLLGLRLRRRRARA